jgi:hypothetical protein
MTSPRTVIIRELNGDEQLLWAGKPKEGIFFRTSDVFFMPFSILWGGGAIFLEYHMIVNKVPLFFAIWGIPFVLIGLYMMVGRFYVEAITRASTAYGVTNQRIIIISQYIYRRMQCIPLITIENIIIEQRNDGSGTIIIKGNIPFSRYSSLRWPGLRPVIPSLEFIVNVRGVYDMLRSAI